MNNDILRAYSQAAFENAEALVREAALLLQHGHFSRSYFLAVAAIEETGKSLLTFDAQGRNLTDPAVIAKLNRAMSDHESKIRSAFTGFLFADPRTNIEPAARLIVALHQGREPAMYTDLLPDLSIQVPSAVVRDVAAQDCVRLARDLLASARKHMSETVPPVRSRAEDQLFALKSSQFREIMTNEDFWWYYIAQAESGQKDFAQAVLVYRADFLFKNRRFRHLASENQDA